MIRSRLTKVNISWGVVIVLGVGAFALAKRQVDRNRVEMMRSKKRIRDAVKADSEEYFRQQDKR